MATAAGARGAPADIVGLADEPATVLRQVAEASRQTLPAPPRAGIVDFFETFGRVLFEIGGDSLSMLALFGSIVMSLVGVIARPRTLRWRSVVHNLDQMGVRAVPIVALMTFLVGCIIAQQGFFNFRKFGADRLRGRHGDDPRAARDRRAARHHHGGGALGQRVHGRDRLDEDARGDRCAAHHGARSDRRSRAAAGSGARHRRADPHLHRRFWRRFMAPGSSPPLTAR